MDSSKTSAAEEVTGGSSQSTLFVFDFDNTIINENSDTYIVEVLAPTLRSWMTTRYSEVDRQWTQLMDETLLKLQHDHGFSLSQLDVAVQAADLPKMANTLRIAHAHCMQCPTKNSALYIVSDANVRFINKILEKNDLLSLFPPERVISNPSHIDESGALRVTSYHASSLLPHGCELCPENMCKGKILRELRLRHPTTRVVYFGDGGNDYCPTTQLERAHDWVHARRGYLLEKRLVSSATCGDAKKEKKKRTLASEQEEERDMNETSSDDRGPPANTSFGASLNIWGSASDCELWIKRELEQGHLIATPQTEERVNE